MKEMEEEVMKVLTGQEPSTGQHDSFHETFWKIFWIGKQTLQSAVAIIPSNSAPLGVLVVL